jgi:hypothetical protein
VGQQREEEERRCPERLHQLVAPKRKLVSINRSKP